MENLAIDVIVLAAGKSSRMGEIKQLLPLNDNCLLTVALSKALALNLKRVRCILGANAHVIQPLLKNMPITVELNHNWASGLSSSIKKAVQSTTDDTDALLFLLGDQPLISVEHLKKIIETAQLNPTVPVATNYQKKCGIPALFPRRYFNQLLNLTNDSGAKELLNNEKKCKKITPLRLDELADVDTPEDYQQMKYLFSLNAPMK